MSTLFTVNKSPSHCELDSVLRLLSPGDGLLFIEDGVYFGMEQKVNEQMPDGIQAYCLKEDMVARGMLNKLDPAIEAVSYRQFVDLCVDHDKVVSWF